jgi:hypothetical protein
MKLLKSIFLSLFSFANLENLMCKFYKHPLSCVFFTERKKVIFLMVEALIE